MIHDLFADSIFSEVPALASYLPGSTPLREPEESLDYTGSQRLEIVGLRSVLEGLLQNPSIQASQSYESKKNYFGLYPRVLEQYSLFYQTPSLSARPKRLLGVTITNKDLGFSPLPSSTRPLFWMLGLDLPRFLAQEVGFDAADVSPFDMRAVAASIATVVSNLIFQLFSYRQVVIDYSDPRSLRLVVHSGGIDPGWDYQVEFSVALPANFTVADVARPF